MTELIPEAALAAICRELRARSRKFALVGGLAVSVRAEVRFTRDVDLAVRVANDEDAEALVYDLRAVGYTPIATVEHQTRGRHSTARLLSCEGVKVDLLFASSGIEDEIVGRATSVEVAGVGSIPVASAEELVAMKILSMTEARLQDRIDVQNLLEFVADIDIDRIRDDLARITERGFHREQDLAAKFASMLRPG